MRCQNSSRARRAPAAPPSRRPWASTTAFMAPADVPEIASMCSHGSCSSLSSTPQVKAPCAPPPCKAKSTRTGWRSLSLGTAKGSADISDCRPVLLSPGTLAHHWTRLASTASPASLFVIATHLRFFIQLVARPLPTKLLLRSACKQHLFPSMGNWCGAHWQHAWPIHRQLYDTGGEGSGARIHPYSRD